MWKSWQGLSHRDELLRAFRIGPADIEANRLDRLGPGQVRRLRRNIWLNVLTITPFQLALIAFIALGARIPAGVVRSLVGPVTVHIGSRGGTWLTVEGERNRLWTGYWHVGRGRDYRVYVVPAARLIVAMEPDGWE
jgi:hypothetical protein